MRIFWSCCYSLLLVLTKDYTLVTNVSTVDYFWYNYSFNRVNI